MYYFFVEFPLDEKAFDILAGKFMRKFNWGNQSWIATDGM